jgi:paraquat-inducible protein B
LFDKFHRLQYDRGTFELNPQLTMFQLVAPRDMHTLRMLLKQSPQCSCCLLVGDILLKAYTVTCVQSFNLDMQEYEALQSKPVAQLTGQDRQRLNDLQEQLQSAQQQLQAAQQLAQQAQLEAAAAQRKAQLVATANVSSICHCVTVRVTVSALQLVLGAQLPAFPHNTLDPSQLPTASGNA